MTCYPTKSWGDVQSVKGSKQVVSESKARKVGDDKIYARFHTRTECGVRSCGNVIYLNC